MRDQPSFSRIDRFLITADLMISLPNIYKKLMPRLTSEHFSIMLVSDGIQWGPIPFCLDNKWITLDSLKALVNDTWKNTQVNGTTSYRIAQKLKTDIKNRTKTTGRQEEEGISDIIDEIDSIDRLEELSNLTYDDIDRRNKLKVDMAHKLQTEASSWKQKCRENWHKDGDRNSKYFHMLANHCRMVNFIDEFTIEGQLLKNNNDPRNGACKYFQKLYTKSIGSCPRHDDLIF